jgi:hypothetical protein
MLLSFRFANHRSFRDEQQLNLLPVYEGADSESLTSLGAVPVVGIFGANASGKSNVLSAFDYVRTMVGRSDRDTEPGLGPQRQPFRLDPEGLAQPSRYAADLLIHGTRFTYGFALNDTGIVDEWLYSYPLQRKRVVFERSGQDFDWGEESRRSSIRKLTDIVSPTALFLSVAARFGSQRLEGPSNDETVESLHSVYSWLWRRMSRASVSPYNRKREAEYAYFLNDPALSPAIVNLLRNADLGLLTAFDAYAEYEEESPLSFRDRLRFIHRGAAGDDVSFGISDESSGTVRLLELATRAIPILKEGGVLLIDEIDASLHPLLTATLVRLFQSPSVNESGAQLVFTTHDATLLGSIDGDDILDRDQVWFTGKRGDGSSELFALAEFKPRRQGENRQKRYLNGSYGAIPELSMRLFEQALETRTA